MVLSLCADVELDNIEFSMEANGGGDATTTDRKDMADAATDQSASVNAHVGTINKLFTQELKDIADRDPLHDLTEQVL